MKNRTLMFVSLLAMTYIFSSAAIAQDNSRGWENGAIVAVTEVHTKPGMFNAYINDLNNVWRKFIEEQMKDGSVLSYGMYSNVSSREGEPDLFLTVTYANWAAFDLGEEYFNKVRDKVMGSAEVMRSAGIKRGELRTLGSSYNLQEVKFRD